MSIIHSKACKKLNAPLTSPSLFPSAVYICSRTLILSFVFVFLGIFNSYADNSVSQPIIAISQIVEHPALNAVREGLLEALAKQGFVEAKTLSVFYENAQGNISLSSQIATKMVSEEPNVMIGISTPSAQTLLYAAQRGNHPIPVVFTAVSDYKAANLEPGSLHYPITGISDAPDLEALLELMSAMMPKMQTLGVLYNPAEANSVSTVQKLKTSLESKGIKIQEVTVNTTIEVSEAMRSLMGHVDAFYFPQDNTIVSAIATIVQLNPGPIFCNDPSLINQGVLGAVGYDYKEVGRETGELVVRILKGEDAAMIPVVHPKKLQSRVNATLAKKMGLNIPVYLKQSEIQIVESK
jgi:putative ABC transport system substrate-binding protein